MATIQAVPHRSGSPVIEDALFRHLIVVISSLILTWELLQARHGGLARALADSGTVLIALAVAIGPLARRWPRTLGQAALFRRELGIYGCLAAVLYILMLVVR